MLVLGIVGSPRKNRRTNELVDYALQGAASAGAETQKVYLIDYEIRAFGGQGGSSEAFTYGPRDLAALCGQADALVLGAPVYWGDINGLTKDFMDTVQTPNSSGKPALGTAIAGGSGKGLLSGVQSVYHFFYHRQFRAVPGVPVSRFNWDWARSQLMKGGELLVSLARQPKAFAGASWDDKWPDVTAHYATLPYLRADPVDEFVMLAEELIHISADAKVEQARAHMHEAYRLLHEGNRGEAGRRAVTAYQLLFYPAES